MNFFEQPEQLPIQGRNVVLFSVLKGRSDEELRDVLTSLGGKLSFFQVIRAVDTVLACFETEDQASQAVSGLREEEIHFADVRMRYLSFSSEFHRSKDEVEDDEEPNLLLPARVAQFMTSPPPSPPEGWKPLHEDINRIAHEDDIQETPITQKKTLLLEKSKTAPRITVEHD